MASARGPGARTLRSSWLEALAAARTRCGLTQSAVAAVLLVSPRTVYCREAGRLGLRVEDLGAMAHLYRLSDEEIARVVRDATPAPVRARIQRWGPR